MSVLGTSVLSGLGNGGTVHGYNHAGKTFTANQYQNAGRYKFLFHVYFEINSAVSSTSTRELSYMVKSVELPKFNIQLKELNQYNRKRYVQTEIKYNPVSIRFHDDNAGQIRDLWRAYYNYYYTDGRYDQNIYAVEDKYGTRLQNNWGLNSNSSQPFFRSIQIYSFAAGDAEKVTLFNPAITSFNHDSHDYASSTDLLEHTMTIQYEGVKYEQGTYESAPGFADFRFYDTTPSDLAGNNAGMMFDSNGNLVRPSEDVTDRYLEEQLVASNAGDVQQELDRNDGGTNQPTIPTEIIITNDSDTIAIGCVFPEINDEKYTVTLPVDTIVDIIDDSGMDIVDYAEPWQNDLQFRGYTAEQIDLANRYLATVLLAPGTNILKVAIGFLNQPGRGLVDESGLTPVLVTDIIDDSGMSPTIDTNTWDQVMINDLGYNQVDIDFVNKFFATVKFAPGTTEAEKIEAARAYIDSSDSSYRFAPRFGTGSGIDNT